MIFVAENNIKVRILPAREYIAWHKGGKEHRDGGPAIIYSNGKKYWYKNGKIHRDDGPAAVFTNGEKRFYIEAKFYQEKTYWDRVNDIQNRK